MASTAEIKGRIASVRQTQKITNAMYLIASTKLRKARSDLEATRPYFAALRTDIFKKIGGFDPEYFMYVEDADLTQKALQCGQVYLLPQFKAVHAWHRAPMRDAGKFKMQLVSMGRYFRKWGCRHGKV